LVNMKPSCIEDWLETAHSREVGWSAGGRGESVGHKSGRRIVEIKRKRRDALTTADVTHMRKVVGYIKRHLAQRPGRDVAHTRWRYSLMNWGHDPLRDKR